MALQTGLFKFTGQLDNVIGYRRNGKYFLRSAPDKVRQTAATKRAARSFGIACSKGKLLRHALRPHLNMRCDSALVNRLNKLFIQAGRAHFPNLQGFHFNKHTGLEKLFTLPPVFTANGSLHIPAQELLPQGKATHIELRLIATRIDFAAHRILSTDASTAIIELKDDEPFNGMALNVPIDGDGVLIVALQYRSYTICNGTPSFSLDRRFMAANIIHINLPAEKALTKKGRAKTRFSRSTIANTQVLPPVKMNTRVSPPAQTMVSPLVIAKPVLTSRESSKDQRVGRRSNLPRGCSQRE